MDLPAYEQNYFCRWVVKATEKYFEDPDVQRRFAEYLENKRRKEGVCDELP